ncbi:MAG: carbohydrate-binding protein [Bacteroidetes bacterium]|nr:carbohydrate-binding protein [Bacteroidota bacterium]
MKKNFILLLVCAVVLCVVPAISQTGYYDAPYSRYEADQGVLLNASATSKSFAQNLLQSEASEQVCVNMTSANASVSWTVNADGDGLVVRYSVPDGQSGVLDVQVNNVSVGTLNLSSNWSWEYLESDPNPNNNYVVNTNPKMRFDEVRLKMPSKALVGQTLKLLRQSGNIYVDFAELELIPAAVQPAAGDQIFTGDGTNLQTYIDGHGGKTIYLPADKKYDVGKELYFGSANTKLKGAGMWYTQINFTENYTCDGGSGGLNAQAAGICYSGLYLTTVRNSRSCTYKGINGIYTNASLITNVWAEHFECGAWIAQYNGNAAIQTADGFTVSNCRFRNNYADGINLCRGTSNAIVEHCSFRNNGDDDMAIWPQDNLECKNNTFRYNTSENCWRSAGVAIYGGLNNSAHHLLIKDNVEIGIRVGNNFPGSSFNTTGMHTFSDITILRCGTFNDLFYSPVGAIDILVDNVAGNRINNVKFSNINIVDSKNDAIYIYKKNNGDGFYNLIFENITVNGTGKEYPNNNANNYNWPRGFGILFGNYPAGNGTYCNITYSNRGGTAGLNVNKDQIGTFSWTYAACEAPVCSANSIPSTIQAENYCDMVGIQTETTTDVGAGLDVGYIDAGDWLSYKISVPKSAVYAVQCRVASITPNMSLKFESVGGTVYATVPLPNTGGWQTWQTVTQSISLTAGVQDIVVKTNTGGFNFNWLDFSDATAIEEESASSLLMYPNPVSDLLTINSPDALREILIYDATGRLVFSQSNPGNNFSIDFANYAAGFYTVVAIDFKLIKHTSSLVK